MSDTSSSRPPRDPAHEAGAAGRPWHPHRVAGVQGPAIHRGDDPVTEWLLEHPRIDAAEFRVLFAIHKLNSRPRRSGWIRRTHLCRSSGLSQVRLTRVLNDLRDKGLVGISRHRVDSSRARYVLIVG